VLGSAGAGRGLAGYTAQGGLAHMPGMDSISSTSMELPGMLR
jgi:hypothetical protein